MKTDQDALNRMIGELARNSQAFAATTAADRRDMVVELLKTVAAVTDDWVASGCRAKGAPSPIVAAEEIINGPAVTFRFLQLTRAALDDLAHGQKPRLPAAVITDEQGRVKVPILPAKGLFDPLNFLGFRAYARMLPEVTTENLMGYRAPQFAVEPQPGITLVLGAGNVSSIPLIDVLSKLFHEGQVVLLKVNPVNEYLGPIFERALAPLMARGFVRIAYGGGDVGASAINHPDISSVHITGSAESHDMIVWGPPGEERERRKRENSPLLRKPITSELGNVSPWIVVPGKYSARQLAFQAENIAASITNNVSFNCVATKLIVTNRDWPDRDRFLDLVDHFLRDTPRRKAYYPGAVERYRRFAGDRAATSECDEETLPWTLRRDVHPAGAPHLFTEESFVCVCAETGLAARDATEFLRQAVEFVNEQVWGTLCAAVTVPAGFANDRSGRRAVSQAIDNLRYGAVCLNHWPALVYAMMTPPWGGFPGSSLKDIQSGRGWVHNAYMLQGVEKTVLSGPLAAFPKPIWFPGHPRGEQAGRRMMQLYADPSWPRWVRLLASALSPLT